MHHRRQGCTTLATILTTGSEDADANGCSRTQSLFSSAGTRTLRAPVFVKIEGFADNEIYFVPVLGAFMTARSRDIVQRCRRAEQPLAKK